MPTRAKRVQPGIPSWTIVVPLVLASLFLVGVSLTLLVKPSMGSNLLLYTQLPPTTTVFVNTSTMTTTTTTSTSGTSTSTTTTTTTTIPAPVTLAMSCPPNVTVTYASQLFPSELGNPLVTPGTYSGCVAPVTMYNDYQNTSFFSKKRRSKNVKERMHSTPVLHHLVEGNELIAHRVHIANLHQVQIGKKTQEHATRTIHFPNNSQSLLTPIHTTSNTGEAYADASSSVGHNAVVSVVKTNTGSLYTVHSLDYSTVLGQFYASTSLAMPGGACSSSQGDGHVLYDYQAQRWILLERPATQYLGNWYLCLYMSYNDNPLGMYTAFEIAFGNINPSLPRIGRWSNVYAMTINSTVDNLCVIDREELLNGTFSGFCTTALSGTLSGFMTQSWTPLSIAGESPDPPSATENANSIGYGAVFMRHRDDELHNGANTPAFDIIDVEHWSNINFTMQTYSTLRYPISVCDFDSSFLACPSYDSCIPTPGVSLDPVRSIITHQLLYYNRGPFEEKVVGAFVSHANGVNVARVQWFQLSFQMPTPTTSPQFVLVQEGVVPFDDGIHRWLPAITQDANGTIVVTYNFANDTVAPGIASRYKVVSDPDGQMRAELIVFNGTGVPTQTGWGQYASINSVQARLYHVSALYLDSGNWVQVLFRLHLESETFYRRWIAEDGCNVTTCVQEIVLV